MIFCFRGAAVVHVSGLEEDIRHQIPLSFTVCLFLFMGGYRGTAVFVSSSFFFKGVQKGGLKGRSWVSLDALMFADLSSRIWSEREEESKWMKSTM